MGRAEDFTNLGEDIMGCFDARVNFLGKNIVDTHRFLTNFRKSHKEMGRKLRATLHAFVGDLQDTVDTFRKKNQKDNRTAHQAWQKVCKTMAAKRHNFHNTLRFAKQKAGRTH